MPTTIFEDLVNLGFKIFGYDASRFNDNPDTERLPDLITSMKFGFAFAGFRGGLGVVVDSLFFYYWKACKGLCPRLVYWYLDYYSHINMKMGIDGVEWGKRQARAAWESHKNDPGELPLYLDIENATSKTLAAPISVLNVGKVMQIARAFLEEYDRLSGGFAGMYFSIGNINWFGDWFKNRPLWVAWYNNRALVADEVLKRLKAANWRNLDDIIVQFKSDGDINKDGKGEGKLMGFEEPYLDINYYLGNGKPTMEQWSRFAGQNSGIPEVDVITPEDEPVIETPFPLKVKTIALMNVNCPSGLNVRNAPKTWAGSKILNGFWLKDGQEVECLEKIKVGNDTWWRVGQGQIVAGVYNGIEYLK